MSDRVVRHVAGLVVMPWLIVVLLVVGLVSPPKTDVVGRVSRWVPTRLAQWCVRDSRLAWRIFTLFEAIAGFAMLASHEAARCGVRWRDAARVLLREYRASQPRRVRISSSCRVELHDGSGCLLLFVPGGAWSHGDDARLYRLFARAARAALDDARVAVVEYDAWPASTGATMARDVGRAVRWALAQEGPVVLVGHSAGAHLLAFALVESRARPRLAVLCSGLYDLNAHVEHETRRGVNEISALSAAFPDRAARDRFSPRKRLRRASPDGLPANLVLLHGLDDAAAPPNGSRAFADALAKFHPHARCSARFLDDIGHSDYLLRAVHPDAPFFAELRSCCVAAGFFRTGDDDDDFVPPTLPHVAAAAATTAVRTKKAPSSPSPPTAPLHSEPTPPNLFCACFSPSGDVPARSRLRAREVSSRM